jgi:hypothetical protein
LNFMNILTDTQHKNTIQAAENRDVLLLYFRYGIYDSPVPATFLRSMAAIAKDENTFSPQPNGPFRTRDCFAITATSEIGQGATGIIHGGTLTVLGSDRLLDIAIKLAFDREQRDALRHEYKMYRFLWSKWVVKGITTALGFFDHAEQPGPCALVMLSAGDSLVTTPDQVLSVSEW